MQIGHFLSSPFALLSVLIGLAQPGAALAQDWGVTRYAHTTVNIRATRSTQSQVVGQLKPGEEVKVDFLSGNWFAVFSPDARVRDESKARGYVYASLLKPNPYDPTAAVSPGVGALQYRVVKREDVSYRGAQRMVFRVMLNTGDPSEAGMRELATRIWNDGNRGWDEFTVFLYLPGMNTNSVAYGIGEFRKSGLKEFTVIELAKP